ncbi:MAG TPA: pyrrolo-quinoline quinone [Alphaproteobacteria bacterium]|nr:pyrrolo-quinoline quinone [Alphaproteobacteria bacterium]
MAKWIFAVGFVSILISGCDTMQDIIGRDPEPEPLPGERISVLALEHELEPDLEIADQPVRLPRPRINYEWPQTGGGATHVMQHPAAEGQLIRFWSYDIGAGETKNNFILSAPVIANDMLFAIDSQNVVSATDIKNRKTIWRATLIPKGEIGEGALGGGIAYNGETVYVTTAYGYVVALNPENGGIFWWRRLGVPIRSAPTVAEGRVFVLTVDNQLHALNYRDGTTLWKHSGISETTGLLGSAVPAVAGDLVVVTYSSGELFAMRVENGRIAWSDSLTFQGRLGANTVLSDIDASPVIEGNVVYSVSYSGRLVAIDIRSGTRIWEQEIASANTPWLAGDYLYVMTVDSNLVCIRRTDGRIRWVRSVPAYIDPEDQEGPIVWTRPTLVGDRLIIAGSHGEVRAISPYTGRMLGLINLSDGVRVSPITANGTLYILTTGAEVVALR